MYESDGVTKKYIFGTGETPGGTYNAAKLGALEVAKLNIAQTIGSEIAGMVSTDIANDGQNGVSTEEVAANAKSRIAQKLGRMIPVVEMYKTSENGKKIVTVTIAYDAQKVRESAEQIIRNDLKKKTEELGKDVDKLLGM